MIRGWCPSVHAPMPSGDGLLARVKPFGGRLSSAQLGALAEAAAAWSNGTIELTGRGNLQVRGVHDVSAFAAALVAAGLADPDPVREARRNVMAVPPCDDALVAAAEAVLADMPGLPPKFGVVVAGGAIHVAGRVVHDAGSLRAVLRDGGDVEQERRRSKGPWSQAPADERLLFLPFGATDAAGLASLAKRTPAVRTTPWRALLSDVPVPSFAAPGTIAACPGGPACASGTVPARADAVRLQEAGFARLHVSGCSKGCASPGAATTLVGRDGRYDLVRHGLASDPPDLSGLTLAEAMAAL